MLYCYILYALIAIFCISFNLISYFKTIFIVKLIQKENNFTFVFGLVVLF
jgi:hypothetical protein